MYKLHFEKIEHSKKSYKKIEISQILRSMNNDEMFCKQLSNYVLVANKKIQQSKTNISGKWKIGRSF